MKNRLQATWARRILALLTVVWVSAIPALALACPQCAGREGGSVARSIAIGSFVMLPFAVAWGVFRFIKKGEATLGPAR